MTEDYGTIETMEESNKRYAAERRRMERMMNEYRLRRDAVERGDVISVVDMQKLDEDGYIVTEHWVRMSVDEKGISFPISPGEEIDLRRRRKIK